MFSAKKCVAKVVETKEVACQTDELQPEMHCPTIAPQQAVVAAVGNQKEASEPQRKIRKIQPWVRVN